MRRPVTHIRLDVARDFFSNLTPLFAALMSLAFLGEAPHLFHAFAFLLIVGGIVVSSRP